jgi:exonuclease III
MLKGFIFFLSLLGSAFADTECPYVSQIGDRRADKNKLRLVQYNVEWLFIDYYSPMNCPGSGCTWKNQSDAEKHMDYVTKVVKELNPDIINFCEIEGCDELNILKNNLMDTSYMPYLKKGTDTSTGQNVGMLTRVDPLINLYRSEIKYSYPVAGSKCGYTGSGGTQGVSKHFITEFNLNGYDVAFIAAHLLAIPTDPTRCSEREAQASVLQNIIYSYISKGYEIVVLGDFNDYDAQVKDLNSNNPTSRVLDIIKGYSGDHSGTYELYNIAEEILQKERFSDWWDSDNNCNTASQNDFSMIDHILVSNALRYNIVDAFIYHGYNEYCGKYDSDHYPVVVDFMF